MIRSYADCHAMFATRKRKLARNTYLEAYTTDASGGYRYAFKSTATTPEQIYAIKLHSTYIIAYHPDGRIMLDSGGWRTPTTKDRMNEFSPIRVWQDKGVWYARDARDVWAVPDDQRAEAWNQFYDAPGATFADGMTFHANGRVTGVAYRR